MDMMINKNNRSIENYYEELKLYLTPDKRQAEAEKRLAEVREKWDVKQSVVEWKKLINELCTTKGLEKVNTEM